SLLVQSREGDKPLGPDTKTTVLNWKEIPFTDEQPPSEAFRNLLGEVMAKLPLAVHGGHKRFRQERIPQLAVPENMQKMISDKPASILVSAYRLQFLGMLFPEDTTAMEHLLERSLVLLDSIDPRSPDYALLKARALFYLHRRPAALEALGAPATPEEKAFLSLLNGNLPGLRKYTAAIKSPLRRLMSEIEMSDLGSSYGNPLPEAVIEKAAAEFPAWRMLIERRLKSKHTWNVQSNLEVKQALDEAFPIPHFTAKDLVTSRKALGEFLEEGSEIELSVYNHYKRILEGQGREFCSSADDRYPGARDYLDLLYGIGESNLLKGVYLMVHNQGLEEAALRKLVRYDTVYRGHPGMTYLRGSALARQWNGGADRHLLDMRDELYSKVFYWAGGQIKVHYAHHFPYYDADYPQRPFWSVGDAGNREELRNEPLLDRLVALSSERGFSTEWYKNSFLLIKYTHDNFYALQSFIESLTNLYQKELRELFERNRHRFIGNPDRAMFLIRMSKKSGSTADVVQACEDAIAGVPNVWNAYLELGRLHIRQGDFRKAAAAFRRYPLFQEGQNENTVKMTNYAIQAAVDLSWLGAVEESIPFFRIAANSGTGSGAEMMSAALLSLFEGDYAGYASHLLQEIKRYGDRQTYSDYLAVLHVMGFHEEARALFNTMDIKSNLPDIWRSAFIGHRMESKETPQIIEWLMRDNMREVTS
ncbi:MAG TPA: hypothetical protein VF790_05920, partial [Dissulfurispiraceae bacterium]